MDGRIVHAQKKLDQALKDATDAALELHRLEPGYKAVPHYSVIEQGAHEVGIRLSRLIQQQRTREVVAEAGGKARCPGCQKLCEVVSKARTIQSVDGKVKILEAKARCSHCQRDFFPSADAFGD